tara:strand:- start:2022 stop:3092 length:1071 start_codon:yes stop_codon:yes gene_type:complete
MKKEKIKLSNYGFNILQIETTAACNMSCSFCPYSLKNDKTSKLSIENIYSIIDQIDIGDDKFKYLTFSQFNEPLLDNRIFDISKYAIDKNFKVMMITNGLLLNKEKNIKNLIDLKADIKISLQVLDDMKHKNARGLNLELEKYVNTIVRFCEKAKDKDLNITIDVGCNFNDNKLIYFLKLLLGIQTGDPSVPLDLKSTTLQLKKYVDLFYNIAENDYKKNIYKLTNMYEAQNNFTKFYKKQTGFKIARNITLKFKPFFYGKSINDFYARDDNFKCNSQILSVQADGNIVPCCLAYDDSISMGKVEENSLKSILDESILLKNLRKVGGEKHETCKKCFGEPTKRGVKFKQLYSSLFH